MVHERLPNEATDVSILAETLKFKNGRIAKNRFMKAPTTEKISSWDSDLKKRGLPSERVINIYEKWGQGQFGLIVTGNVPVDPHHLEAAGNIIVCKENETPQRKEVLIRWAKVIKAGGALAIMQLAHPGRQTPNTINATPFSASDVQLMEERRFNRFGKPIPLTVEQIKTEVIERFTYAAKVAYEAGFDGVEVHAAHGNLLTQFMTPSTNKRTDKYGGTAENRVRVVMEIFDSIRKEIPVDTGFIVGIKINSGDFQEEGFPLSEAKIMCQMIEDKGFDFVEIGGATMENYSSQQLRDSTIKRESFFFELSEHVVRPVFKKTVVYVTGGFRTVGGMVAAVKDGLTDGIGLARPITAEPDLPRKILGGHAFSAAATKLDTNDFWLTIMAANSQIALMGHRPLSDVDNDFCADIPDLSNPKEAEHYAKAAAVYGEVMKKTAELNEPLVGVLEYTSLSYV